jgi:hypothetical protein
MIEDPTVSSPSEGHTVASLTGGVEGSQRDAVIDSPEREGG